MSVQWSKHASTIFSAEESEKKMKANGILMFILGYRQSSYSRSSTIQVVFGYVYFWIIHHVLSHLFRGRLRYSKWNFIAFVHQIHWRIAPILDKKCTHTHTPRNLSILILWLWTSSMHVDRQITGYFIAAMS